MAIAAAAGVGLLFSASMSLADDHPRHDRDFGRFESRGDRGDVGRDRGGPAGWDGDGSGERRWDAVDSPRVPPPRPPPGEYDRHARPRYGRWSPGQVLPPDAPAVVVIDYERFHLRRPPPGYVWLRCDDDFLLTASGSGVIFDVVPALAR